MNPSSDKQTDALGTLGHELRTPLAAIIGYADAMRARVFGPLDETYADCAQTIHEAALHMLALVDNLATLAGDGQTLAPRPRARFDAKGPFEEVLRLMAIRADTAGVTLSGEAPPGPIMVDADEVALRQIAINLIANALAATPRGGRVTLAMSRESGDLVLAVQDTGRGLLSGAPPVGTGLGLPTVRALCAAHAGDFMIANTPGGGVKAIVRLPIATAD